MESPNALKISAKRSKLARSNLTGKSVDKESAVFISLPESNAFAYARKFFAKLQLIELGLAKPPGSSLAEADFSQPGEAHLVA